MADVDDYNKIIAKATKIFEKDNKMWTKYVSNITQIEDLRVIAILVQAIIEWYLDRLLWINFSKSNVLQDIRYQKKIEILKNQKILDQQLEHDLLKIYDIRNEYAHELEIYEQKIRDILDSVKRQSHVRRNKELDNKQRFLKYTESIIKTLQRTYMSLTVDKLNPNQI